MSIDPTRGNVGFGLALMACAFCFAAFADAPAVSIKTKIVDITVTIDDALKASPGLVNDCLREGQTWADKSRSEAEKERRDNPGTFDNDQRWSLERAYTQRSVVGRRYVSVLRTDDTFMGGAHPNTNIDTILWDREAQRRISIRPFFNDIADNGATMTALAHLVRLAVASAKITRLEQNGIRPHSNTTPEEFLKDESDIRNGVKATLLKLGPVTLAPSTEHGMSSGLTFHFEPYAVGAYAEGPYTVFVSWTTFKQYLSGDGSAIFAGARPKGDEQQQ